MRFAAIVLAGIVGVLIGAMLSGFPPSDDGQGGILQPASAQAPTANVQLTYALSATNPLQNAVRQDLVLVEGQETYTPSPTSIPNGTSDLFWGYFFYNDTATTVEVFTVDNGGAVQAESGAVAVREASLQAFWAVGRMPNLALDSKAAVAEFHLAGGALAAAGHGKVTIGYQLHKVAGAPVWDIAYRDAEDGEPILAGRVDAVTGAVTLTPSRPPMDLADAEAIADATSWAADAKLYDAVASESKWTSLSKVTGLSASVGMLPPQLEEGMGDGPTSLWFLEYYSAATGDMHAYVVFGTEVLWDKVLPLSTRDQSVVASDLSGAPAPSVDLRTAVSAIASPAYGAGTPTEALLFVHDGAWKWQIIDEHSHRILGVVDAVTGTVYQDNL